MYHQEKKKQINLYRGYNYNLNGKIIDKVSLYVDNGNCENGEILITFTDDTFILLAPQMEFFEGDNIYQLQNRHIQPISQYSSKPGYVKNGEFKWSEYFQRYIDCGIIDFDKKIVERWIKEDEQKRDEREYQEYLRLKEKFEKTID